MLLEVEMVLYTTFHDGGGVCGGGVCGGGVCGVCHLPNCRLMRYRSYQP